MKLRFGVVNQNIEVPWSLKKLKFRIVISTRLITEALRPNKSYDLPEMVGRLSINLSGPINVKFEPENLCPTIL